MTKFRHTSTGHKSSVEYTFSLPKTPPRWNLILVVEGYSVCYQHKTKRLEVRFIKNSDGSLDYEVYINSQQAAENTVREVLADFGINLPEKKRKIVRSRRAKAKIA